MKDSSFLDNMRTLHRSEIGGGGDPIRRFLWWLIKTLMWAAGALVIAGLTIISIIGAYAHNAKMASMFGVVILIIFVMSHFVWMGKKD